MKRSDWLAAALATTALAPLAARAAAPVLPTGGRVTAGSAVIAAPASGTLTVSQTSGKAIIDWGSFSIGSGGKVSFLNGSGATLNRVTGASLSTIDGLLTGTGSVYLINPNGVIIGKNGVVNVGGTFVASTLDTPDSDFLKGGALTFAGSSQAAVVNYGKIGSLGGDVALVAANVANSGTISAANGDAGLLAGYQVVLRDASLDQGRFSVLLGGSGTSATNSGLIQAADAELRAEGGNVYALAGDTAGVIRATGVKSGGGHVWLVADHGALDVAGSIEAQGAGGKAGGVETSGAQVSLGAAKIDAHGGTWLVDPYDLTIDTNAAGTIDAALDNGTSVVEQTGASSSSGSGVVNPNGSGDIIVSAPIAWNTAASLTLSAYRNVDVNAPISTTGGGTINLFADNAATGGGVASGNVIFGSSGSNTGSVTSSGIVNIYYNPVSYSDTTTGTFNGHGYDYNAGVSRFSTTSPYSSDVSVGATLYSYMLVDTLAQLQAVETNLTGEYRLNADIDASSTATMNPVSGRYAGFVPIGFSGPLNTASEADFMGFFDGGGHTISNLYVNRGSAPDGGLFARMGNFTLVENLNLTNANITATGGNTGAVVGFDEGGVGTIYASTGPGVIVTGINNVSSSGTITGYVNAGGIAGANYGSILNSHSSANVTGYQNIGGLSGQSYGGNLINDYATGSVTGTDYREGGLVGVSSGVGSLILNSYATGAVSGNGEVGGLVGEFYSTLTNGYATGAVTATNSNGFSVVEVGGLIGNAQGGSITNTYATGSVSTSYSGAYGIGGLVGFLGANGALTNGYATGAVTAPNAAQVGGLVGWSQAGDISQSYSTGAVQGADDVGGLVGRNDWYGNNVGALISDSYATGSVTGTGPSGATHYIGGLVGENLHDTDASNDDQGQISTSWASGLVSGTGTLGGLVGGNGGIVTSSVWDRTSTGQAADVGADEPINGASVSTNLRNASVQDTNASGSDYAFSPTTYKSVGFTFSTTPGTAGAFVIVDTDGTLNGQNGATRPILLSEYSTTITNAHQLQLAALATNATYTFAANVNASGTAGSDVWGPSGFIPLGQASTPFNGTLNGAGYSVSGLTINEATGTDVGLVGALGAGGLVETLTVTGKVIGASNVGVLVGYNAGTVSGASGKGNVTGGSDVGGVVGYNSGAVSSAYGKATVAGAATRAASPAQDVGGLVGLNTGVLTSDHTSGAVTGEGAVGGVAGANSGSILSSYATGSVSSISGKSFLQQGFGGLVGVNTGKLKADYATGAVTANDQVGGLVGMNGRGGTISVSYATGAAKGLSGNGTPSGSGMEVGGLMGENAGTVANTYATGQVNGASGKGGLLGVNDSGGTVSTSYATGKGGYGFAGTNNGTLVSDVFDTGTTGVAIGVGSGSGAGVTAIGGSTGLNPDSASSYAGFDFTNVWTIAPGSSRPYLRATPQTPPPE